MAVTRVFLGWDQPAIHLAARWLHQRYASDGAWDLSGVLLVVPGRRAGRRLLEVLVEQAGKQLMSPPDIATLGDLPERLHTPSTPIADDLQTQLGRLHALRSADPAVLRHVVPNPPGREDLADWLALSDDLANLHETLAADQVRIADVAPRCRAALDFIDDQRWGALTALQHAYEQTLAQHGLQDRHAARFEAIEQRQCATQADVVLLATADLNRVASLMLEQVGDHVTALIHAPESEADSFDELGALRVDRWLDRNVDLPPECIRVVDRPRDQAYTVLHALADLGQHDNGSPTISCPYGASQITVGLGDEAMAPMVHRTLELAGLPAHSGFGQPLSLSRPALLLATLGRYATARRFDDFAALLRHPDVEDYVTARTDEDAQPAISRWLTLLDTYATDTLQRKITGRWLGSHDHIEPLQQVYDAVESLLPADAGHARPLPHWSRPIADGLQTVYARQRLHRHHDDDEPLIRALETIGQTLGEQAQLDPANPITPRLTFAEAIRLTLARLAKKPNVPPEGGPAAIELLGWLELQLDDAPVLIVTAVNEGTIPASRSADAFVPNAARRVLGLADNDRRYARDLMALTAITHSRPAVTLIAGRHAANNDPLTPSRLLLACDQSELPDRIDTIYPPHAADDSNPPRPIALLEPGDRSLFVVPRPQQPYEPITSLPVTAFRDYLASPYRFYLKHVLKLETLDDRAAEMDGRTFGTLAHDVLSDFGNSNLTDSTDAEAIADFLSQRLEALVRARYGSEPSTAVVIQREQLRDRLNAFARWQAEQVEKGWRIIPQHVETRLEAAVKVDGQPFTITGRIDRIDEHPQDGYRVIDYKTSDTPKSPQQTHRHGPRSDKKWIDLQLPLYRTLVATVGITGRLDLGYLVLPKDLTKIAYIEAKWDAKVLDTALAEVHRIIREIRAGRFWPPSEPPDYDDGLRAICMDLCLDRGEVLVEAGRLVNRQGGTP
ncbi:MAG: PD-(D/E)XK nuclease family protein [Phycisphaeraceae bacterium]